MEPTSLEIIVQAIVGLATVVITTLVAPWLLKQGKIADERLNAEARDALYPALFAAIDYARGLLTQDEQVKLGASDALKAQAVRKAADYIERGFGKTLVQLGVTRARLEEMLQARLQTILDAIAKTSTT